MGTEPYSATGRLVSGGCKCSAVRYGVLDELAYAANCHCSRCRARYS
jgi:hypothetical protein